MAPAPTSIAQIDLSPLPGKSYTDFDREWREEFIYFLMVDRFQDDAPHAVLSQAARSLGYPTANAVYGGKIAGITKNLAYIAGLGCTAIWLSPVVGSNSYYGYDVNNYLDIDPRFGTKQDLIDLVDAAHGFQLNGKPYPIRVILDVVTNHSGDNWAYPNDNPYFYFNNEQFDFGFFRDPSLPVPTELRNPDYYHRRGQIRNYDTFPEAQQGDLFTLKDYENDDDVIGSQVVNTLIAAHCYWIKETDVDGFRMDAVKHMGPVACSWFCSNIREYAYSLGKRGFFLYGEVATPDDDIYDRYIGQNTSVTDGGNTVYFGLDSVLDFRLAEGETGEAPLRDVLKGFADPSTLFNRLENQRNRALNRGEIGKYLVTFVDNHDSFWQPGGRFGAGAPDAQIIAAIGYLLCTLGTACIYYGTEQGFQGAGGDVQMREAMYDNSVPGGQSLLNVNCNIYQEIAKIAAVMRSIPELRFGRMYFRPISGNGQNFGLPTGTAYTLAFSRMLYGKEVLVAYNVSEAPRADYVAIDATFHKSGDALTYLYGGAGAVPILQAGDGTLNVQLPLSGNQFVILR